MDNEDIRGKVTDVTEQMRAVNQDQAAPLTIDPNSPFALKPTRPEQKPHFDAVSKACDDLYQTILAHVPSCSDRTLAIRDLQQVRMWANAAIVHDGPSYNPGR